MFYYSPMNTSIRNYLESDCINLINFLRNMKQEFWPDWIDATEKLMMKSRRKLSESAPPCDEQNLNNDDKNLDVLS